MRQTTKFLRILMCMVLGLSMSFQSCKDYDDDIDKLNNRIDGVITDLTTLKETVKGLIKEVTYDAATGKLTVTPVNGDSKTYAIGQSLPTYELKVSGASCWLEKDGQQSGDKLEIAIPDAPAGFDETKLTVKTENGKYCIYYNEKKTNVEIAVPTENSIQKTGNTVTIVLGDKTVSFTLSAGDVLKSLVFEPQAYLNGVEAMKARGILTDLWEIVTSDKTPTTTGEIWKENTTKKVKIGAKVVAYYHVNPSTVDPATIKGLTFITKNREKIVTRTAANDLNAKLISYKIVKGEESDSPMLQVIFTVDVEKIAAFDADALSTIAVQASVQEVAEEGETVPTAQIITSDYAAVYNTTITDFRLASKDITQYAGMDSDGHLYGTVSGKAEDAINASAPTAVVPEVITVVYDNSEKVKLENYVVSHYTEKDYQGNILVNCDPKESLSRAGLKALGLDFRFAASNYVTGNNQTPQNEFFSVDPTTGEITVKVYQTSGTAAIGRMPLVRVELFDTLTNNVVNVGWIKLLIIRDNTPGIEKTKDFSTIKWGCSAVIKQVDVEFMNTQIYNALGLSKDDFHAIYKLNTIESEGDGTIAEKPDDIQDETYVIEWTISDAELKAATNGKEFTHKVVYSAKGRQDVVITLKATVEHPKAATVGEGIKEYWDAAMTYVRLNVEVVDAVNKCDFIADLLSTFNGNKLELNGKDNTFTEFTTLNYSFIFSDKNVNREVTGLDGTKYNLNVQDNGKSLYADNTKIASLSDASNAMATASVVTYENNEVAKNLLNKAGHLELGEGATFYAWMNVKAINGCGLEYPLSNGEFKAYFLRPVDVLKQEKAATLRDAQTNGSTINLMDLIELKDWREEAFQFTPVNFYDYYKVEQIVALAGDHADVKYPIYTTLNGNKLEDKVELGSVTKKLVLTASEGIPVAVPTSEADLANYGTLTLKNNGAAVGAFKLNVPVKVVYKWGEVIEYIVVDVLATQGN